MKKGIINVLSLKGRNGEASPFILWTVVALFLILIAYVGTSLFGVFSDASKLGEGTPATTEPNVTPMRDLSSEVMKPRAGDPKTQPSLIGDHFRNGDFEGSALAPWFYLKNLQWGGFRIGRERFGDKNEINHYVRVVAMTDTPAVKIKVFGAVQEWLLNGSIPQYLNFKMRVVDEKILCSKQYAQVVLIYHKDTVEGVKKNVQLRIVLHGVEKAPYNMSNAKFHMMPSYVMKGRDWRQYSLPVQTWFRTGYPHLGEDYFTGGQMRILVEARYDNLSKSSGTDIPVLTVDYDDISFTDFRIN